MTENLAGQVLVFSDNDGLARVIELRLKSHALQVTKCILSPLRLPGPSQPPKEQVEVGKSDLIVVALSAPESDPMAALARAALVTPISQSPILMICARSIPCESDGRIMHMDFPFDIDDLYIKVEEILQSSAILHIDTRLSPVLASSACF